MTERTHALSRLEAGLLWLHRTADRVLSPLGIWVFRRSRGRVADLWKVDALLLTTHGRRSGHPRTVVLQYFRDGEMMVVVAANDGGKSHPGWYHNLVAQPVADVEIHGRRVPVRAEELDQEAASAWWRMIIQRDPSYKRYRRATDRRFPIIRLMPIATAHSP
jgi:deazaflavin-dependent oxidoreductase (nitroreductase family)